MSEDRTMATGGSGATARAARERRPFNLRLRRYARAMTDMALVAIWLVATFTGAILWETFGLVPEGPAKGQKVMLWGLTKAEWGEIHWWVSAAAVLITLFHIFLDWKAFKGAARYLWQARGMPG